MQFPWNRRESDLKRELAHHLHRGAWMFGIWQDFAFALRQMRRSPGFAVTAIVILALGIAANVIVFGVLQAVDLRPPAHRAFMFENTWFPNTQLRGFVGDFLRAGAS
jgi:hypothetical protein